MQEHHWHSLEIKKLLNILKTSPHGLDANEVKDRQKRYGLNQLPRAKPLSAGRIFLQQFTSPLIIILLIATGVSFVIGEYIDAAVIFAAVIMNAIVGFIQENKAQNALLKLQQAVVVKTIVRRNGKEQEIDSNQLVPGDIIVLRAGDKVPADARILSARNLQVNEAVLTGESWEQDKKPGLVKKNTPLGDRENMLFMGTVLTNGQAEAVVVSTGKDTELGRIAIMLRDVDEQKTPLQLRLEKLSKQIGIGVLIIVTIILLFGIYKGHRFVDMFKVAIAIAVSAIPEGLVVALTVVLAISMQRILQRNALVRRLVAAEALGSTTVICTDKTGTLTTGEMRVAEIVTDNFYFDTLENIPLEKAKKGLPDIILVLRIGVLCSEAVVEYQSESLKDVKIFGNMTERALIRAGILFGIHKKELLHKYPQLDVIPFDSDKKFMATLHKENERRHIVYTKGAPEIILSHADYYLKGDKPTRLTDKKREEFQHKFEALSKKGLRILAVAFKEVSSDKKELKIEDTNQLVFVGFIGLKDPIREGVRDTIDKCRQAGIKVVMITGDHVLTAQTIAKDLKLATGKHNIITGDELRGLSEKEFYKRVTDLTVYARVSPADKLRIIKAWQSHREIVAMTGDGVNDAPALKSANIGVAMGSGTEVAKEVADLVILDDHFATIVAAIEQGRVIYDNIKKVVLYLMSNSLAEVFIIMFALLVGWPLPLLATQILWINIIGDGLPSIALTYDPEDPDVMKEKPRNISKEILSAESKLLIILISAATAITTLIVFYYFWQTTGNVNLARTVAFTGVAVPSLIYVFSCRTLRHDFFTSIKIKNNYLWISVIAGFLLQLAAIYSPWLQKAFATVPLGIKEWIVVFIQGILILGIVEAVKALYLIAARKKKLQASRLT